VLGCIHEFPTRPILFDYPADFVDVPFGLPRAQER
jgi:hypothetical protein